MSATYLVNGQPVDLDRAREAICPANAAQLAHIVAEDLLRRENPAPE